MADETFVERRIRGKAAKNGLLPDRCIDFRDLPSNRRESVLGHLALEGTPVLLFWEDDALWTILTTSEIVGCIGTSRCSVALDQIDKQIKIEAAPDASQASIKLDSSILQVGPGKTRIWVPAGPTLFGLWNTLLMFPLSNSH